MVNFLLGIFYHDKKKWDKEQQNLKMCQILLTHAPSLPTKTMSGQFSSNLNVYCDPQEMNITIKFKILSKPKKSLIGFLKRESFAR